MVSEPITGRLRVMLIFKYFVLPGCFICLLLFVWGRDQLFSPRFIESKLRIGMTLTETEQALAIPVGSTSKYSSKSDAGDLVVKLSDSGLGSLFVPQNAITLIFDFDGGLKKCHYDVHWRMDEIYIALDLPKK